MTMKLKVQHLMDSMLLISEIIRDNRPMPQKGKYRLSRMHAKFLPEFERINLARNEMIKSYDTPQMIPNPAYKGKLIEVGNAELASIEPQFIKSPTEFMVPAEKLEEFTKKWMDFAAEEIEVDVEPIPLEQLCLSDNSVDGSITAHEFSVLGDLVKE